MAAEFKSRLGAADVAVFSTPRVAFMLALQGVHMPLLPDIRAKVDERWGDQIFRRTAPRS